MAAAVPDYSEAALVPTLGMYALPYAATWPDLSAQLTTLYQDKAGALPWLPANWLDNVLALHGKNGMILVPAPPVTNGQPIPFLATPDQVAFWGDFNIRANAVISAYAAQQAANGKALLDQLYADADFWNTGFGATMIAWQQAARSAAGGIASVFKNPMTTVTIVAGVIGLFLYLKKK